MSDFLLSSHGTAMMILIGIVAVVGYVLLVIIDSFWESDFDPVCEQRCKKCICYKMCKSHGCKYDCPDYMTEEMLKNRGLKK